jgi:hypothetical protein
MMKYSKNKNTDKLKYKIDRENHRIDLIGSTDNIRKWIITLDQVIYNGGYFSQLEESLNNLEKINRSTQYTFGHYFRIYYNRNSLTYIPNVSGKEANDFWFKIIEHNFKKTQKVFEKE